MSGIIPTKRANKNLGIDLFLKYRNGINTGKRTIPEYLTTMLAPMNRPEKKGRPRKSIYVDRSRNKAAEMWLHRLTE